MPLLERAIPSQVVAPTFRVEDNCSEVCVFCIRQSSPRGLFKYVYDVENEVPYIVLRVNLKCGLRFHGKHVFVASPVGTLEVNKSNILPDLKTSWLSSPSRVRMLQCSTSTAESFAHIPHRAVGSDPL